LHYQIEIYFHGHGYFRLRFRNIALRFWFKHVTGVGKKASSKHFGGEKFMKRIYAGILTVLSFSTIGAFAQTAPAPGAPVTGKTIQERKNNQQKRIS
jgi:hypothetical protein